MSNVDRRATLHYLSGVTEPAAQPKPVDTPVRTEAKKSRDAPALSAEYHKARKQLMLWSAILLIWSLVGVDLDKAKEAEGGVGAVVNSIKSPQAVPWALVILAVYFTFKFTVEWYQCNAARRSLRASKADYISAWVVFALANILYFGQLISRVQFADVLQGSGRWQSALVGAMVGFILSLIFSTVFGRIRHVTEHAMLGGFIVVSAMITCVSIVAISATNTDLNLKYFVIGGVLGAAPAIVLYLYLMELARSSRKTSRSYRS